MGAYKHKEKRADSVVHTWRYRVVVTLPDGSKQRIWGTPEIQTKKAAEEAERQHIARVQNPSVSKVKDPGSFATFVDERWLPTVVNRASTLEEKEVHIRLHLKPTLGHLKLANITNEVIAKLVKSLKDRKLSDKSVKNILATLHKCLTTAVSWNCLAKLPTFPKVKVAEPEWDHFTIPEIDRLLAGARDQHDRLLLHFAAKTGARAGELLAAEWGDVDWKKGTIKFARARTRGETGATKSGRSRLVPLSAALLSELRSFKAEPGHGLIFANADGSHVRIGQLHECLWRTLKKAELREIRWHDLRHSFASNLAAAGVPIPQLQRWMGHSTIVMTMRYAHLAPDAGLSMIGALDSVAPRMTSVVVEQSDASPDEKAAQLSQNGEVVERAFPANQKAETSQLLS